MRGPGSHKGENGRVLIIGGSEGYVGAPALAALAALRSGVDIAVVAAPEKAAYAMNAMSPDLITRKLPGEWLQPSHVPALASLAEGFDCVLIGPGLGERKETLRAAGSLCGSIPLPKVIDADAIKAKPVLRNCIVTPHAREFRALFGKAANKANAAAGAGRNAVVLLKGRTDIVSDGRRTVEQKGGNAGMTVGGTGDVLAGLCAGLVAQGMPLFEAACLASKTNKAAGEALFECMGWGYLASDLLGVLPLVLRETNK